MPRLLKVQTDIIETKNNEINELEENKHKSWVWLDLDKVYVAGEHNGLLYLMIGVSGGMCIYSHTLEEFIKIWNDTYSESLIIHEIP